MYSPSGSGQFCLCSFCFYPCSCNHLLQSFITNQSLETQKKYCLQYALKNDLNVLGFFGGTYESAKTDERNEFNRMIHFVKNQREGVSAILVYSLDRFSRTGDNAIFISSELKKQGTSILSVTQPIDVSTHSGILQQNIQLIFNKYDNDLRKEKCIAGMKEKLYAENGQMLLLWVIVMVTAKEAGRSLLVKRKADRKSGTCVVRIFVIFWQVSHNLHPGTPDG